jgi:hypothetical protein
MDRSRERGTTMNQSERKMLDCLKRGRDQYGVVAVKAEFEAEGTRPDELLRLLELARRADVDVALKIGGCEAVSDLLASRLYGIDYIIAPMVETPYALSKFVEARTKVYGDADDTRFLFNLETETTLGNLDAMLPVAKASGTGVVFGRVDFTLSRGMARTAINDRSITDAVLTVAHACREHDLELVVGGSVSADAVPALREIQAIRLDRFETRKVIFEGEAAALASIEAGIANAVEFELEWLRNKRDHYQRIASEDQARIAMMEKRVRADAPAVMPFVRAA